MIISSKQEPADKLLDRVLNPMPNDNDCTPVSASDWDLGDKANWTLGTSRDRDEYRDDRRSAQQRSRSELHGTSSSHPNR